MKSYYDVLEDINEKAFVYPGHPIVLAYCIVKAYRRYEDAIAPTSTNAYHALGNGDAVPGAGDCVYTALDLLRELRWGMSKKDAMTYANERWMVHRNAFPKNFQKGQAQAFRVAEKLFQLSDWWEKKK